MTSPLHWLSRWPRTRMRTKGLRGSRLGPPRLQVVEARVVAAKLKLDHPGGLIAVVGHDNFCDSWFLVRLVVLGSKQKHHDVRVLLDRVVDNEISCHEVM